MRNPAPTPGAGSSEKDVARPASSTPGYRTRPTDTRYAQAARDLHAAGWAPIPVPFGRKAPPPEGWTGAGAPYPSTADIETWIEHVGDANIAIRLPPNVIDVDVDHPERIDTSTLPPTWTVTARGPDSARRGHLYRVPEGRRWPGNLPDGAGEICHAGYRYVVVAPSVPDDLDGAGYVVYGPDGQPGKLPRPEELPELPPEWIERLIGHSGSSSSSTAGRPEFDQPDRPREFTYTQAWEFCGPFVDALRAARSSKDGGTGRNNALNDAAIALAHFTDIPGGYDRGAVERMLYEAAQACRYVADKGERATLATIASGLGADTWKATIVPDPAQTSDSATSSQGEDRSWLDYLRSMLVDTTGLDQIPKPEPLVHDVLYRDSITWLQGRSGEGKTFVALDLAGCVATGESWHGHPVTQGSVLYVVAEGMIGVKQRVRAWEQAISKPMSDVRFLPVPVRANVAQQWRALRELSAELHPVLVVIDTQARVTVGLEENSAKDMGEFVDKLEALRADCRACILVVHHQGRSGNHMRGSTAMEGAADTEIKVSKAENVITLECSKQKNAEPFTDFTLKLVPMGSSVVLMPERPDAKPKVGQAALRMARRWWELFGSEWCSASKLMGALEISKPRFYEHVQALDGAGLTVRDRKDTEDGTRVRHKLLGKPPAEDFGQPGQEGP
jgi:hypothetical protein